MANYTVSADGECCCDGVPVDCPECPTIAEDYLFTLSGTGDLAFLDGQAVNVYYTGLSGGFYNFSGSAVISGWTVTVGWGISQGDSCLTVAGNIQLYKAGECDSIVQEMHDPASTTSLTACDPATFTITSQQLYNSGEGPPGGTQCFTGTIGGVGVQV